MNAPAVHRVRRLSWQARAPAPGQACALRTLLQERGDAVQALLDRVLDGVVPPDTVLRLPRLEVAVHAGSIDELERELLPQLEAALKRALTDARLGKETAGMVAAAQQLPGTHAAREALCHYLAQGDLPWPQQALAPDAQRAGLVAAALALADDIAARPAALAPVLPADVDGWPGSIARWLVLLPVAARTACIDALARALPPEPQALRHAGAAVQPAAAAGDVETVALWMALVVAALARPGIAPSPAWRVPGATMAAAREALRPLLAPAAPAAVRPAAAAAPAVPRPPQPPSVPLSPRASATAAASLVPLAGLVLLNPYLPRLLHGCGLVTDEQVSDEHLPRACTLLHALATGEPEAPEFALPFVKLLLGRAPDEPLPAPPPLLQDDDRAEIDALLAAVREHWTALRGTGAEGLRVSFLQRRGLLERRDGAWQLRLQREPFDLLLGLLPWGFGFVKLPWMRQPLVVEWPAS